MELLIDGGASPAGSSPCTAAASPMAGDCSSGMPVEYTCHVTGAIEIRVTSSRPPRARHDSVLHSALDKAWGWPVSDRRSSSGRHKLGPCAWRLLALEGRCAHPARGGLGCGSPWGRDTRDCCKPGTLPMGRSLIPCACRQDICTVIPDGGNQRIPLPRTVQVT